MRPFGSLLPPPLSQRRDIPFYYDKSEQAFRTDIYERYDALVTRQTALHLADDLHGSYPFRPVLEYLAPHLPTGRSDFSFLDLGCSVGRVAGEVARDYPAADVYGLDLSYQMLRQAYDYWVAGRTLRPNLPRYGWGTPELRGFQLPNLHFALASANDLPFADHSLDVVFNAFLLDRLPAALTVFAEWGRVLKPAGRLVMITPLNFLRPAGWREAHPPVKIVDALARSGWSVMDWTDPLELFEPLDARGNGMRWRCVAGVFAAG